MAVAWGLVAYLPVILIWMMGVGGDGVESCTKGLPTVCPLWRWLGEGQEVWARVSWLRFKRGEFGTRSVLGNIYPRQGQDCGLHITSGGLNGDVRNSRQRQ